VKGPLRDSNIFLLQPLGQCLITGVCQVSLVLEDTPDDNARRARTTLAKLEHERKETLGSST
jgi:hypothetical protein